MKHDNRRRLSDEASRPISAENHRGAKSKDGPAITGVGTSVGRKIEQLRCEYRIDPIGVDSPAPRFSWRLGGSFRTGGAVQAAYRVIVASTAQWLAEDRGDLWDSGRVESDQSLNIDYAGQALASGQSCFWKVCVWAVGADRRGRDTPIWSEPATWRMGLLTVADWQAKWIRDPARSGKEVSSPWLRKTFELAARPDSAIAYVESHGYHELWVNGRKVGSAVLSPAVSVVKKRTLYVAYDLSHLLQAGENVVGLWLGRGWNVSETPGVVDERPVVRLQMDATRDGEAICVVTDESWRASPSPYTTIGPWKWGDFGGERYDARLENAAWCEVGCEDSAWSQAEITPAPEAESQAQAAPLNKIGEVIPAVDCTRDELDGGYSIDFGTDLTGWVKLAFTGLFRGQIVRIQYRESGGRDYNQLDEFIAAGRSTETFVSKFNYRGFRTVFITGLSEAPDLGGAEAYLIESDLEPTGSFACSNGLFNRIERLNRWTLRCLNLGGYLVDCPHRERLGYGDGQVSIEGCIMNWWMPNFYEKWLGDWRDTQDPLTGALPFSTPYHYPAGENDFGREGPPGWGGTLPVLAWKCFLYYGDRRILEAMMPAMRLFMARMESHATNGIVRSYGDKWQSLGDWVPPERGMDTDRWPSQEANEFFNNCYLVYLKGLMENAAEALGLSEEAGHWRAQAAALRPQIHAEFYRPDQGIYVIDEQAYQVMPLLSGVTPESLRPAIMKKLEEGILGRCQGHLDTGMLGTHFLIQCLEEIGRDDLLFTIMNQTDYPGWGHMLEQGATTMWEQWNGFWSRIHSCFTSPSMWFYQGLAGIRPDPLAPGFKKFVIKPAFVGDVAWVKAHYDSPYGQIVSHWERGGDAVTLNVTVPANTTAIVYMPGETPRQIGPGDHHFTGLASVPPQKERVNA